MKDYNTIITIFLFSITSEFFSSKILFSSFHFHSGSFHFLVEEIEVSRQIIRNKEINLFLNKW